MNERDIWDIPLIRHSLNVVIGLVLVLLIVLLIFLIVVMGALLADLIRGGWTLCR